MAQSSSRARQLLRTLCPDRDLQFDIVRFDALSRPSRLSAAIDQLVLCAFVGVSITTSSQARVASIVFATPDIVVVITGLRNMSPAMIATLESRILCNPNLTLLGLDMQEVAFGLYSDVNGVTLSRGIDILSLFDRTDPNKFITDLLGSTADPAAFGIAVRSSPKPNSGTLSIVEAYMFALSATRPGIVDTIRTQPWPHLSTAPERIPREVR